MIVDLNGDDTPDLALANAPSLDGPGGGTVSLLLNRGHGTFEPALFYPARSNPSGSALVGDKVFAVGDLNSDGKPDLATVDVSANRISVLLASTAVACTVPAVTGKSLAAATGAIVRSRCRVGIRGSAHSKTVRKGRIISQNPRARTVLPKGGKVDLVVSLGAR